MSKPQYFRVSLPGQPTLVVEVTHPPSQGDPFHPTPHVAAWEEYCRRTGLIHHREWPSIVEVTQEEYLP